MATSEAVKWLFLLIFVAAAALFFMSFRRREGLVKVPEYYRKRLFALLILDVISSVVVFGASEFRASESDRPLKSWLLDEQGWDWQYAEKGWRSKLRFEEQDGQLSFVGETVLVTDPAHPVMIRWQSSEPFRLPEKAQTVEFRAIRTWTRAAGDRYPAIQWEVDKPVPVVIRLRRNSGLRGVATDVGSALRWGITMTSERRD
jgi:hypothetical protein